MTRDFVKHLRSHQTEAEQRLWFHLRDRRLLGLKFRRQYPIGPYVVDFVCLEHRLIVEVDGSQHMDDARYAAARDRWLSSQGYRILRAWNHDALGRTDEVLEQIRVAVERGGG